MTKNVEGQPPEGQEPTPAGEVSGQTEAQLSQQGSSSGVSQEDFDSFKNELLSQVGGLQGAWDKQTQQVKNEFEATLSKLNIELSPDQKNELRFMNLEKQLGGETESSPPSEPTATGPNGVQSYSKRDVLKDKLGLDPNDYPEEVWGVWEQDIPQSKLVDMATLAMKGKPQEAPPNPANSVAPAGKTASPSDETALNAEYAQLKTMNFSKVLPSGQTVKARMDEIVSQLGE